MTGRIGWVDLTVDEADKVKDFYREVVGWSAAEVPMAGGYHDFTLGAAGARPVAGVCHARGANAGLPPVWLIYITVADLEASLARVAALGGRVLRPATDMGPMGRYAVIADPAGAPSALFQPASEPG